MHGSSNRVIWRQRLSPGSAQAYALATVFVVLASLVRWGFSFVSNDIFIFAAFYPAVLFGTYVGGLAVGIFAACAGSGNCCVGIYASPTYVRGGNQAASLCVCIDLNYLGRRALSKD